MAGKMESQIYSRQLSSIFFFFFSRLITKYVEGIAFISGDFQVA